jgi:hypothetical protein
MMKNLFQNIFQLFIFFLIIINTRAYSQNSGFRAGIAKIDITPSEDLYMGGYDESCRMGPSQGHQGNIYVRAIVIDDNATRIALVETDVVSLPPPDYDSIRNLISSQTGIPFDNILLGCVHNHAAPYPGGKNIQSDWYRNFSVSIIKAVKMAVADLEPVKTGGGTGKSYIGMNRRKIMSDTLSYMTFDENNSSQSYGKYKTDQPVKIREMEGVCRLGANPEGSIDNEIGILRFDKLNGQPKAILINYACHGTSLGGRNNIISPEWNGHMLEYIEKQFPGLTGIFIQGAAGDINPRFVGGLDGRQDNLENTAGLGIEIGKEIIAVFSTIKTEIPGNPEIKIIHDKIICPKKYDYVVKDFRNTTVAVSTTIIKFDNFTWVTFPGELFHEIGKTIKYATHSQHPFFIGYCNGSLGYLPTREAYSEGGYEPWATQFDPATEKIYVAGVEKLLIRIR